MSSESSAQRHSCMQTHLQILLRQPALCGKECHAVVSFTLPMLSLCQYPSLALLIPCSSSQWLSITSLCIYFVIASTLQSCDSFYNADFLQSFISVLCCPRPPPHFILCLLAGWRLNCDPAHCSISGAAIWECIWYSCVAFTFGSVSAMFMIQYHRSGKNLQVSLLPFCLRSCSTEVLCFFRYANEVASCATEALTFQATWTTAGGETKWCIRRILVNKRDILRHQSPGSLPWPRKTFHWAF